MRSLATDLFLDLEISIYVHLKRHSFNHLSLDLVIQIMLETLCRSGGNTGNIIDVTAHAGMVGFGQDLGATRSLASSDESGQAMEATAAAMLEADRRITDPFRPYKIWRKVCNLVVELSDFYCLWGIEQKSLRVQDFLLYYP